MLTARRRCRPWWLAPGCAPVFFFFGFCDEKTESVQGVEPSRTRDGIEHLRGDMYTREAVKFCVGDCLSGAQEIGGFSFVLFFESLLTIVTLLRISFGAQAANVSGGGRKRGAMGSHSAPPRCSPGYLGVGSGEHQRWSWGYSRSERTTTRKIRWTPRDY